MDDSSKRHVPPLDAVYESLAEEIEGWAKGLGTQTEYFDPVLEEGGRHEWAASLRRSTDWSVRTALSLLSARGGTSQADDLKRRMEALYEAAEGYEQRLDALEDQRRVHVEGLLAQYRKGFGDEDPGGARLGQLCQGPNRLWTLRADGHSPETPEEFAEAIDRVWFDEDGAKRRAQAEVKRQAMDLVEHFQLLAAVEANQADATGNKKAEPPPATEETDSNDEDLDVGLPEQDPFDDRVVNWIGKRLYLGRDTQVSRLFWLLVKRLGAPRSLAEVQLAVDGVETLEDAPKDEFKKAMNRVAKALSKLRRHLRENELDTHVFILKEGPSNYPTYTMFCRFGKY